MNIKPHIILTISIIVIILIYLIYLNFIKKGNIEGFSGLSEYVDPAEKIDTLITSQISKTFEKEIWNNQTVLDALPTAAGINLPVSFAECNAIGSRDLLTQCPVSIWEPPTSDYGFSNVGHIISRNFVKPSIEKIIDYRQPKTPAGTIEKSLDTMLVAGANLKDPEDYIYVGSFGSGEFSYNELSNETYKKKLNDTVTYVVSLINSINAKLNAITSNINLVNASIINKTVIYLNRMLPYINVESANQTTIDNANEILNTTPKNNNNVINTFKKLITNFQTKDKSLSVKINIEKTDFIVENEYITSKLTKDLPGKIRNHISNGVKVDQKSSISGFFYTITFSNIQTVSQSAKIASYTLGDQTVSSANDLESSKFTASPNFQLVIKYTESYWSYRYHTAWSYADARNKRYVDLDKEVDSGITEPIIISNDGSPPITEKIFSYNQNIRREDEDDASHPRKHILEYYKIIPPAILTNTIYGALLDNTNQAFLDGFNTTINQIKTLVPNAFETTYRTLTIWQPVPPKEYVALGFYFTNKGKDNKPSKTGLKCIPKSCAKSFNRRLWRKEDLIFIYKDQTQHLHF